MERKYKNYSPTTFNSIGVCNDYLSEHDLLAYIDGNLTLYDTQNMERIIFEKGNEFYLDILIDLKERYIKYEGDTQAVCQELDKEAEQIPFFREKYKYVRETEFIDKDPALQERFDEMNRKIEAISSIVNKSIEDNKSAGVTDIAEPEVNLKTSGHSNIRFMEFWSFHAFSKFLERWIYRQLIS